MSHFVCADAVPTGLALQAPISAVLHARASLRYRQMFHLLWRIKRVEWTLALAWRRHMSACHVASGLTNSNSSSSSSSDAQTEEDKALHLILHRYKQIITPNQQ